MNIEKCLKDKMRFRELGKLKGKKRKNKDEE